MFEFLHYGNKLFSIDKASPRNYFTTDVSQFNFGTVKIVKDAVYSFRADGCNKILLVDKYENFKEN